jgi:hypothetical protein
MTMIPLLPPGGFAFSAQHADGLSFEDFKKAMRAHIFEEAIDD